MFVQGMDKCSKGKIILGEGIRRYKGIEVEKLGQGWSYRGKYQGVNWDQGVKRFKCCD